MQRSADIEQIARNAISAMDRGDIDTVIGMISRDEAATSIGTDPGEYTRDQAASLEMMRASSPDAPGGVHVSLTDVRGYEHGDVGWLDGKGTFSRGGESVDIRFTNVLCREDGRWKIVQAHASVGVPNELMFDPRLTGAATATG